MEFSVMRQWAIEAGFAQAALCSAEDFNDQRSLVFKQPVLKERKQLRFSPLDDDARVRSIAVLLWPYQQAPIPGGRHVFVDSYYEASNAAYHAAEQLEKRLLGAGVYAKANVSYPAKEAAMRAGLGIIGHNSLFIHPQYGSRVVIILMATEIEKSSIAASRCKEGCRMCGKCAAACPAGAIDSEGMSHPEKCLRNFMMEGVVVPQTLREAMGNRLLGCDICQRVCPMQPAFSSIDEKWGLDDFVTLDQTLFNQSVAKLADRIGRNTARPQRVRAQAALLCGNIGSIEDLPVLEAWAESDFDAVREHAIWAISRIKEKDTLPLASDDTGLDQSE